MISSSGMHRSFQFTVALAAGIVFAVYAGGPTDCLAFWQSPAAEAETGNAATTDPDFQLQGEYVVSIEGQPGKGIQVVARGQGEFRVVLYQGGLPAAGWDKKTPQVIEEEETEGVVKLLKIMSATKLVRVSPTAGASPPEGAKVLFDGTLESLEKNWQPGAKLTPDKQLAAGATSKEHFQDYTLHLEFRTPYQPDARGQSRGNSGVYHQGRYETQILDSFGLQGLNNETGGIYEVRAPDLNVCFPPLSWQTYDVDYTAPRFDTAGNKVSNARMTVRLNGLVVQRDIEVPGITRAAPVQESAAAGPLALQDHQNPVAFRNIWIVERDAEQESRSPRIPGYERVLAFGTDNGLGGQVLFGELGCMNCHRVEDQLKSSLLLKQAPVLTEVGNRVNPEWIMEFIANPHHVNPGTTMPNLFAGWSEADKSEAVLAITNFLVSNHQFKQGSPDSRLAARGDVLFHSIGCVACHAPRHGEAVPVATTVPLTELHKKYGIVSLTRFLREPHAVRPSGRMPTFSFEKEEAEQLAHYLLQEGKSDSPANVRYKVYAGAWDRLPNFDNLQPVAEGECVGFDLGIAGRTSNFGIRFEGYLPKMKSATVLFGLGSDDGSRLTIDGQQILDLNGVHPFVYERKTARIQPVEMHHVRVDFFQLEGGQELRVDMNYIGEDPVELGALLQLSPAMSAEHKAIISLESEKKLFHQDPALIGRGQELFASIGCANCHQYQQGEECLKSRLVAKPFSELSAHAGCLENYPVSQVRKSVPNYDLSPGQRRDLAALCTTRTPIDSKNPEHQVRQTFAAFNCYACHDRHGEGGPELARNEFFQTTEDEMGDEGRLPPSLNGVGDKLQAKWLDTVLDQGARDRRYMRTRMPSFGKKNVGHLTQAFGQADLKSAARLADFDEAVHRVKSTGRQLVGNGGLACIKCHDFGDRSATGIRAVSLTDMTSRIRADWFLRYLYEPAKYRPGTRMPTGFPNGVAVNKDIYEGIPEKQISAIWIYLQDGNKAGLPEGLVAKTIELTPDREPILFRNFFEGVSPRGIAVGYPEKTHLIWDANELCLRQAWHGRFMDASMHWSGRGAGAQRPLGDHIITLEAAFPFAQLNSADAAWPITSIRETSDSRFLGYQLNEKGQPTFRYQAPFGEVSDFPLPVAVNAQEGTFRRSLSIHAKEGVTDLYFRAATGKSIVTIKDEYRVDDAYTIRVNGGGPAILRTIGEQQELIVPVILNQQGQAELIQEIIW